MFNRVTPIEFRHVLLKLGHSTTAQWSVQPVQRVQYVLYTRTRGRRDCPDWTQLAASCIQVQSMSSYKQELFCS